MRNEYDANLALQRTPAHAHTLAARKREQKQCLSVLIVVVFAAALGVALAVNW